ncbi:MAG: prolyl-tRNA synthetase associated domain-containing protein [Oscillospiraceae bacterium]|nr:prolyl-tRNA synthetase associated domain-containing protein [Oscillospiraceae bacterium]
MHESLLFQGRPEKGSRREIEERSYDLLDSLAIDFLRVDHDEAMSMEDLNEADRVLGCTIAKNLFLTNRQQTDFYLLIMPGSKPFKTKYLSAQLGCSRLSFASEEKLTELLGVKSGSASLLGLMNDEGKKVRLVIDKELLDEKLFACHPCRNTSSIAFSMDDMLHKLIPALGHEYAVVDLPWEFE